MTSLDPRGLPPEGAAGLGVAVSGGRDSVGLLHRILESPLAGVRLRVVHVDHGMHEMSRQAAEFVQALSGRLGVPCRIHRLESPAPRGETEARDRRYGALVDMARCEGLDHIAVAHHRADQVETRLHNLLRGCAPAGLRGMSFSRILAPGVTLCRPALHCSADWLHEGADDWIEDPTNASGDSPRHVLRHRALPVLESIVARDLHQAMETTARLACEDDEALEALVPVSRALAVERARDMPRAVLRRWLRRGAPLDAAQVERGLEALAAGRNIDLGRGLRLRITDGVASLECQPLQ